ncbi:hypothetical protein HK405_013989 [Cladochytrium tenue]|nr:hypothetical protein HK405_013989 [Cladochytrium tenue]
MPAIFAATDDDPATTDPLIPSSSTLSDSPSSSPTATLDPNPPSAISARARLLPVLAIAGVMALLLLLCLLIAIRACLARRRRSRRSHRSSSSHSRNSATFSSRTAADAHAPSSSGASAMARWWAVFAHGQAPPPGSSLSPRHHPAPSATAAAVALELAVVRPPPAASSLPRSHPPPSAASSPRASLSSFDSTVLLHSPPDRAARPAKSALKKPPAMPGRRDSDNAPPTESFSHSAAAVFLPLPPPVPAFPAAARTCTDLLSPPSPMTTGPPQSHNTATFVPQPPPESAAAFSSHSPSPFVDPTTSASPVSSPTRISFA